MEIPIPSDATFIKNILPYRLCFTHLRQVFQAFADSVCAPFDFAPIDPTTKTVSVPFTYEKCRWMGTILLHHRHGTTKISHYDVMIPVSVDLFCDENEMDDEEDASAWLSYFVDWVEKSMSVRTRKDAHGKRVPVQVRVGIVNVSWSTCPPFFEMAFWDRMRSRHHPILTLRFVHGMSMYAC
jgi:hypothetical protein